MSTTTNDASAAQNAPVGAQQAAASAVDPRLETFWHYFRDHSGPSRGNDRLFLGLPSYLVAWNSSYGDVKARAARLNAVSCMEVKEPYEGIHLQGSRSSAWFHGPFFKVNEMRVEIQLRYDVGMTLFTGLHSSYLASGFYLEDVYRSDNSRVGMQWHVIVADPRTGRWMISSCVLTIPQFPNPGQAMTDFCLNLSLGQAPLGHYQRPKWGEMQNGNKGKGPQQ